MLAVALAAAGFIARPLIHLGLALREDGRTAQASPPGILNDVGRLNPTPVDSLIAVSPDSAGAVRQLQDLIAGARAEGRKISIAGARHSMGGHTLYPHALVLDMRPFKAMRLDTAANILHVGSGALWIDILRYLDGYGRSVEVMQGNSSFSVGGSISVNCHGWEPDHGPISSTVLGFRLLRADGVLVRCSREENPELFSLALGGYGLFGVILDVDLHVVRNEEYAFRHETLKGGEYPQRYLAAVAGHPEVGLAYGRLDVSRGDFLGEAMLKYFVRVPEAPRGLAPPNPRMGRIVRAVFMGSAGSDYGKALRWTLEKRVEPLLYPPTLPRNQILSADAETLANHSAESVDILQEYFLPGNKVADFIASMKDAVPRHAGVDLLNITIRRVKRDTDTFLPYAREDVFAFVMSFRIAATPEGDRELETVARDLIERVLALGGTFYLPYRLHATPEQLARAYPSAHAFFAAKAKYDPEGLFRNLFYEKYGLAL